MSGQASRDRQGAVEVTEIGGARKGGRRRHHDARCSDHDDERSKNRVRLLVLEPTWGVPFGNDVRLLKEEVPGGDRGANHGDDRLDGVRRWAAMVAQISETVRDGF